MAAVSLFGLLCALCAILAVIDIRDGIIPDWLNLAIAALGFVDIAVTRDLTASLRALGEGLLIGAMFWLLRRLYFAFRNVQGLGLGDVKFLGAAGIWVGIAGLPLLVVVATLTALARAGIARLAGQSLTAQTSLPFGPFLAAGLVLASGLQRFWF